MTFDWAQIAYIGSPLLTPWWTAAYVVGGLVIVMRIIAPILCKLDTTLLCREEPHDGRLQKRIVLLVHADLSSAVFDDKGKPFDVNKILTPDFLFDKEAYEMYSRVYLLITYVLAYAVQLAGLSALVTHTVCWHGRDIWKSRKSR